MVFTVCPVEAGMDRNTDSIDPMSSLIGVVGLLCNSENREGDGKF